MRERECVCVCERERERERERVTTTNTVLANQAQTRRVQNSAFRDERLVFKVEGLGLGFGEWVWGLRFGV